MMEYDTAVKKNELDLYLLTRRIYKMCKWLKKKAREFYMCQDPTLLVCKSLSKKRKKKGKKKDPTLNKIINLQHPHGFIYR